MSRFRSEVHEAVRPFGEEPCSERQFTLAKNRTVGQTTYAVQRRDHDEVFTSVVRHRVGFAEDRWLFWLFDVIAAEIPEVD